MIAAAGLAVVDINQNMSGGFDIICTVEEISGVSGMIRHAAFGLACRTGKRFRLFANRGIIGGRRSI
jgi:hypothetical protein